MRTQRRIYGVVASRKVRSGLWNSWCQVGRKIERPSVFSWAFVRSVLSLLWHVAGHQPARGSDRRLTWQHDSLGCVAPRSTAVYGRLN